MTEMDHSYKQHYKYSQLPTTKTMLVLSQFKSNNFLLTMNSVHTDADYIE